MFIKIDERMEGRIAEGKRIFVPIVDGKVKKSFNTAAQQFAGPWKAELLAQRKEILRALKDGKSWHGKSQGSELLTAMGNVFGIDGLYEMYVVEIVAKPRGKKQDDGTYIEKYSEYGYLTGC
jgi:hypothetical protein